MLAGAAGASLLRPDHVEAQGCARTMVPHLSPPAGYTASQLVFEDQFLVPTLDSTKWIPQMASQSIGIWNGANTLVYPDSGVNPGGNQLTFYRPDMVTTGWPGLRLRAVRDTASYPGKYTWRSGCVTTH